MKTEITGQWLEENGFENKGFGHWGKRIENRFIEVWNRERIGVWALATYPTEKHYKHGVCNYSCPGIHYQNEIMNIAPSFF